MAFLSALLAPLGASAHGAFHERLAQVQAAIEADPGDAAAYLRRAELYRRHGDWADASADLDRATALDPALAQVDYFRGLLLLDSGRPAAAESVLSRYLTREPDHPKALAARARARGALGRHLEAARDWRAAIEHQPVPLPEYYLARAEALAAAGAPHLEAALETLDEGLRALGPVPSLEAAAIDLELRRGAVDGALVRVDRAASRSPRKAHWLARRGEILEDAGRVADARLAFEEAITELDRVPAHKRSAPATRRLETEARAAVARLSTTDFLAE